MAPKLRARYISDFYKAVQNIQFLQTHLWYPSYMLHVSILFYVIIL